MVKFTLNHVLLTPESKLKDFLDDFLKSHKFSRLWVKTYAFDKHYADILNCQNPCDIRILIDDGPFKSFQKKNRMNANNIREKYFPIYPSKIHNKYIYFKTTDGLWEGVITGSYNLIEGSKFKDNDVVIYYKEYEKDDFMSGYIRSFDSGKESVISSNIGKVKYDFTKSWVKAIMKKDLVCPICGSDWIDDITYCHQISSKYRALSLIGIDAIGAYDDCEECPRWCQGEDFTPKNISFSDENDGLHDIFTCSNCDAIFVDNGGLIGEDLIVSLSTEVIKNRNKDEKKNNNDDYIEGNWIIKFTKNFIF